MFCRKLYFSNILFLVFLFSSEIAKAQSLNRDFFKSLHQTSDITAPNWGPFSKKYAGVSHIADQRRGIRFDFTLVTGYYRGKLVVPNHLFESDFHPWSVSSDLNNYSFRQEIAWKDKVYADIHVSEWKDNARLLKIDLVNNTKDVQALSVNMLANVVYPEVNPIEVTLPVNRNWISGVDYETLQYAAPRTDDQLRADGLLKGEKRGNAYVNGSALADNFGSKVGDFVTYKFAISDFKNAVVLMRYKVAEGSVAILKSMGMINTDLILKGTGNIEELIVPLGSLKAGKQSIKLTSSNGVGVEIDGFTIIEREEKTAVKFSPTSVAFLPMMEKGTNRLVLKYSTLKQYYGLAWRSNEAYIHRDLYGRDIDIFLRRVAGDNVYPSAADKKEGHYANVFIRPIEMAPLERKSIYVMLCEGDKDKVQSDLDKFLSQEFVAGTEKNDLDHVINKTGEPYLFSQQIMKANLLQNVVYPIYNGGKYIRHFTPGKRWNSLYTWDSGFIGLGMAELDLQRAIENLNTYTTSETQENAFVQHGSLVPVQYFLYQELWNKTQSVELLKYFYPRLKKYYLFFIGNYGSSTNNKFQSNLLSPFDYFYNSGGWDDYPAQEFMHHEKLANVTSPIITTAMAIRIAKIMSMAALASNNHADLKRYEADIEKFGKAIQANSWDQESGYFGYAVHDSLTKKFSHLLRTPAGENYNKGLDGVYPLIAGICTPEQQAAALKNLFTTGKMWSNVGLSVVDQSASYYSKNSYWNGAVWFPHQWFVWKTMLDIGQSDYAYQIAKTALDLYKKEADSTYNSYEIYRIQTGRGNGWHQFSGLSAPVLNWFAAYHKPGHVTVGFNGFILKRLYQQDTFTLNAKLKFGNMETSQTVLVCMPEGPKYKVFVNGKQVEFTERIAGLIEITFPASSSKEIAISVHP